MNYFLTQMVDLNVSGIEHAERKRLRLFKENGIPGKIVTRDYNRMLHWNLKQSNLKDSDSINLFDFFQEALNVDTAPVTIETLPVEYAERNEREGAYHFVDHFGFEFAEAEVFDKSFTAVDDQVSFVRWFDNTGRLIRTDGYDIRGFLSMTSIYSQDGGVAIEKMYTPHGREVFRSYYKNVNDNMQNVVLELVAYKGHDLMFDSLDQLTTFFYDQLNQHGDNTFIADRTYIVAKPMLAMTSKANRYIFWHNIQTDDVVHTATAPFTREFEEEIQDSSRLSGIIVSSQQQAEDIQKRTSIPVTAIPAITIFDKDRAQSIRDYTGKAPIRVISVSRIHEQKHLEDTISAFQLIHEQLPESELTIYGYVNDDELNQRLHQQVSMSGLTDAVNFVDYMGDLSAVYDNADLMLVTSRYEGYHMAAVEAMNHGVPVISYNIHYGPSEFIDDGVNGYLIANEDRQEMSDKAIGLLKDSKKMNRFRKAAANSVEQFSATQQIGLWKKLLGGK